MEFSYYCSQEQRWLEDWGQSVFVKAMLGFRINRSVSGDIVSLDVDYDTTIWVAEENPEFPSLPIACATPRQVPRYIGHYQALHVPSTIKIDLLGNP